MDFKGRAKKLDNESMIKRSEAVTQEIDNILGNSYANASVMNMAVQLVLLVLILLINLRNLL